MSRCDDGATFATGLVRLPAYFVRLSPDLHLLLVLVPSTNAHRRVGIRKLLGDKGDVLSIILFIGYGPGTRQDEEQPPEGTGHFDTQFAGAVCVRYQIQSGLQIGLMIISSLNAPKINHFLPL